MHKQKYQTVRDFLSNHFSLLREEKILLKYLPDLTSIYECVKFVKVK